MKLYTILEVSKAVLNATADMRLTITRLVAANAKLHQEIARLKATSNVCRSECDCCPYADPETGGDVHESDCHSQVECADGRWCDRHLAEAEAEHSWMRNVSIGAVTGVMSEQDKQDMRDAGRGHLVMPS
jgi:hypothetical protein